MAYVYSPPLLRKAVDDFKLGEVEFPRPSKKAGCPSGVPDDLYRLPQLTGMQSEDMCMNILKDYVCFCSRDNISQTPC